jgi:hypothetical protein
MKKIFTLASLAMITSLSLAACGGGAQGGSSSSNSLLPSGPSTSSTAKSKASISFNVPKANPGNNIGTSSVSTQSIGRKLMEISPATDKFALVLDGNEIVSDVEVANYNNAGTFTDKATGSTVSLQFTGFASYFTVTAVITTTPGQHTFGVVLKSGTPAYVLSEAQASYTLVPSFGSTQTLGALTLLPAMGTGYIECDTWAENSGSPAGSCNNGQNFIGGTYYLSAVAADYDGFPIVSQGSTAFDNGSYSVVETDGNSIVQLGSNGPFSTPGSWLTGPSSSWVDSLDPSGVFQYGNRFTATCLKVGTASLALQLSPGQGGSPLSPITGYNYTNLNSYSPLANGALMPLGSKTAPTKNPQFNVTVNCSASANLPLQSLRV